MQPRLTIMMASRCILGLLKISFPWQIHVQEETAIISWRECSKKSVQQGRDLLDRSRRVLPLFDARSVHGEREHGKMATCLREALRRRQGTPLAAFFNIPILGVSVLLLLVPPAAFAGTRPPSSSEYPTSNLPLIHPKDSDLSRQGAAPSIQTLVVTSDGIVYAGSFGMGLFRSTDKGQSWEVFNRGLTDPFLLCLAVTPGQHVYAGTMRGGVYRLSLKGEQWESISQGLEETEVKSFLVHEKTVYAGTGQGVYRWNEAERQWMKTGDGLEQVLVPGLAMMDDGRLLAATSGKGLYHYQFEQAGQSKWIDSQSVFVDPRERLPHRYLRVIAVNQAQHIFLGTQDGGIFRSTDRGVSWSSLSRNLPNDSIRGIVPIEADVLVATGNGVFRWKDDQQRWIEMNEGLTRLAIQSLTVADTGAWYVGTSSGAFRSDDEGEHWKNISQGLGVQMVPKGPYD